MGIIEEGNTPARTRHASSSRVMDDMYRKELDRIVSSASNGVDQITAESLLPPTEQPLVEIISQKRLVEAQNKNVELLQQLGMLAAGDIHDRAPYFVK